MVSDWGAVNDRVKGLPVLTGDAGMKEGYNTRKIIQAVENGENWEEEILDRTVERILESSLSYTDNRKDGDHLTGKRITKQRQISKQSAVLGKQGAAEKRTEKVVYIGEFAADPRYQGGDRVDNTIRTA